MRVDQVGRALRVVALVVVVDEQHGLAVHLLLGEQEAVADRLEAARAAHQDQVDHGHLRRVGVERDLGLRPALEGLLDLLPAGRHDVEVLGVQPLDGQILEQVEAPVLDRGAALLERLVQELDGQGAVADAEVEDAVRLVGLAVGRGGFHGPQHMGVAVRLRHRFSNSVSGPGDSGGQLEQRVPQLDAGLSVLGTEAAAAATSPSSVTPTRTRMGSSVSGHFP